VAFSASRSASVTSRSFSPSAGLRRTGGGALLGIKCGPRIAANRTAALAA